MTLPSHLHCFLQNLERLLSLDEADPDERDWLQQTALHIAAFAGNPDVVSFPRDRFRPAVNVRGERPVSKATTPAHSEHLTFAGMHPPLPVHFRRCRQPEVSPRRGVTRVTVAPRTPSPSPRNRWCPFFLSPQVRLLLEAGADPAVSDQGGCTPLHRAALKGHTEAVRVLLEYGAPPAAEDTYGRTPLDCARSSPLFRQECAALLVAAGGGAGRAGAGGAAGLGLAGGAADANSDGDEALRAAQRALKAMALAVSAAESGKGMPVLDEEDALWDRAPPLSHGGNAGASVASHGAASVDTAALIAAGFPGGDRPGSSLAGYSTTVASVISAGPNEMLDGSFVSAARSPKRVTSPAKSGGGGIHPLPPVPPPLPVNAKKSALKKKTHFGPLPGIPQSPPGKPSAHSRELPLIFRCWRPACTCLRLHNVRVLLAVWQLRAQNPKQGGDIRRLMGRFCPLSPCRRRASDLGGRRGHG